MDNALNDAIWIGLEGAAVVLSLLAVRLSITRSWYNFVMSIAGCSLYMVVFYKQNLFFNFFLQLFFIAQSLYGLRHWQQNETKEAKIPILHLNLQGYLFSLVCIVIFTVLGLWALMQASTEKMSWLRYTDAFTTAVSLVAQWLMIRRVLESWLFWIGVDVLYVGLFMFSGLYLSAGLYIIFCIMASMGYLQWRKQLAAQTA